MSNKTDSSKVIADYSGINLDIGSGNNKQAGFVGIDILPLPGVDIVWDIENTPWPLPSECVHKAVASHVLEHINPTFGDRRTTGLKKLLVDKGLVTQAEIDEYLGLDGGGFLNVMNEIWRVLKVGGQFAFVVPHASSPGFQQDPTHINMINQNTMRYFDPLDPSHFFQFYHPKPWEIQFQTFDMNGNLEVILKKRADDKSFYEQAPTDIVQEIAKTVQPVRNML